MLKELKRIFSDSYVLIIFLLGGLIYPIVYGLIYCHGTVDDMPIAVVDLSQSAESRRFTRKLDATREVEVACRCTSMEEAKSLLQKRDIHGIVYFPSDYDDRLAAMEQATVSTYADMASFLYYKDITMAVNHVMLDELREIEGGRYAALGMTDESVAQMIDAIPAKEEIPFNTNFSFLIFFLSAALILVIQQTMFYGISVRNGTLRENGSINRESLLGRAVAYVVIYVAIAIYGMVVVPHLFGMPQRGELADLLALIFFFILACVAFSFTFSHFIYHRETVFVVLLFMSSLCLFLSGCVWPESSFPAFWKGVSCLFPSTFAIQGFNNINNAACTLPMVRQQILCLVLQFGVYSTTAFLLELAERKKFGLCKS